MITYRTSRAAVSALALAFAVTPALATPSTAAYDASVRQSQSQLRKAVASGDAAEIASARAKLKAAQATAWGKRNPAPEPTAPEQLANAATPR